jgi:hypothetical protein
VLEEFLGLGGRIEGQQPPRLEKLDAHPARAGTALWPLARTRAARDAALQPGNSSGKPPRLSKPADHDGISLRSRTFMLRFPTPVWFAVPRHVGRAPCGETVCLDPRAA